MVPKDDTGVISATLVSLGTSLSAPGPEARPLTALDKSVITSCTSAAALLASPLASLAADAAGRRPVILAADALFILGALVQASASSVPAMVLGRSIVGAGVGAASFVTPLYIAELAPPRARGRLVTMNNLSVTFGQAVAYIVGWLLSGPSSDGAGGAESHGSWRWMVGLGALPALLQCLLLLAMPETPRWLVKAGRSTAALRVIRRTLGVGAGDADADARARAVLEDIEVEVRQEELEGREVAAEAGDDSQTGKSDAAGGWRAGWRMLLTVPRNRRALTIACMLQGFQQLCGFVSCYPMPRPNGSRPTCLRACLVQTGLMADCM